MKKDLLLEIGSEEVPAHVMPGVLSEIGEDAKKMLESERLSFDSIKTLGTPRRMALIIKGLDENQPDMMSERRGPSIKAAFDADGNPTKAAQGFARGQKVDPSDLVKKDGYVYAIVHTKGEETAKLLPQLLKNLICGLSFPNNMRWGSLDFKFIRPIRWIVALYGDDVVDFEIANVKSGRSSRGHRFLGHENFDIKNADSYETDCEAEFIIVDPVRRQNMIRKQINDVAKTNGGTAEINDDLLEEVTYLVEYPTALCGHFEDKYLKLPPEAVITPMRDHQRYFPVKDDNGKLLPLFITVRNGGKEYLDIVQHGNERVLRARLADAQFFFDEDRKKTLEGHRDKLKTVVFQEGLGSVYEKTERLMELADKIADMVGASAEEKKNAVRAAELSKADLVTGMVTEFTELQGIMGREYAKLDGENDDVATAIDEHYRPRFSGDVDPSTRVGLIVSIADKVDNIVATFSRGLIPTGSQDPFGLRRQALGLVNQLINAKTNINLSDIVSLSMDQFAITDKVAREKMQSDVGEFIRLRVKNVLDEAKIRYDIADAVLDDVDDVYATFLKANALASELNSSDMTPVIQSFVRAKNISEKADKSMADHIDESLFAVPAEKALYQAYTSTEGSMKSLVEDYDFVGAIDALKDLSRPIDDFFDAVMVMDKDEKIKNNRLGLLLAIDRLINKVADFSKIVLDK
ncbi:MAG: glycine--tRNA ligase subunit beta [Selenomonadaceae bacterium]